MKTFNEHYTLTKRNKIRDRFIYKQTWNFYVLVEDLLEVVPCEAQFLAFHYLQLDEVVQFIIHVEDEGLIDLSAEAEDDSLFHLQGVRADSQVKESCRVSSNGHCILIDVCKKRTYVYHLKFFRKGLELLLLF